MCFNRSCQPVCTRRPPRILFLAITSHGVGGWHGNRQAGHCFSHPNKSVLALKSFTFIVKCNDSSFVSSKAKFNEKRFRSKSLSLVSLSLQGNRWSGSVNTNEIYKVRQTLMRQPRQFRQEKIKIKNIKNTQISHSIR